MLNIFRQKYNANPTKLNLSPLSKSFKICLHTNKFVIFLQKESGSNYYNTKNVRNKQKRFLDFVIYENLIFNSRLYLMKCILMQIKVILNCSI